MAAWRNTALCIALALAADVSGAQGARRVDPSPAELAIAVGRFDIAEAALYEAARRSAREPSSRGALGSFLAARGKFLVGATLLEEARFFGGDSASIEARLLEVFRWTGQNDRAAALRAVRLVPEERATMQRAGATVAGGASTATVPLRPNEVFGLGRIVIAIGEERIEADIHPLANGLQLPATMTSFSAVEPTGARGDTTFAVARAIAIGGVTLGPLPVRLAPSVRVARIGLDVLGLLRPTFDYGAGTLTVRSTDYAPEGRQMPILLTFPGLTFVVAEGTTAVPLHTAAGRAAVRGHRWTLDLPGGAIVVER